ncbi:hypothetical protein Tco_1318466 [Tanacetum coccineum]
MDEEDTHRTQNYQSGLLEDGVCLSKWVIEEGSPSFSWSGLLTPSGHVHLCVSRTRSRKSIVENETHGKIFLSGPTLQGQHLLRKKVKVFDANSSSFYLGGEEASIQKKEPQVKKTLVERTKPSQFQHIS